MVTILKSTDLIDLSLKRQLLQQNGISTKIICEGKEWIDYSTDRFGATTYKSRYAAELMVEDTQKEEALQLLQPTDESEFADDEIMDANGRTVSQIKSKRRKIARICFWLVIIIGIILVMCDQLLL